MTFKLTLNKPAAKSFFDAEKTKGVRIKIDNGAMFFQPVDELTNDSVAVEFPARGSATMTIGGKGEKALRKLFDVDQPYHVVTPAEDGWLRATPFGEGVPARNIPQVRLWDKTVQEAVPKVKKVRGEMPFNPETFGDRIRNIFELANSERRPGRPSLEYVAAVAIKAEFEKLAEELVFSQNPASKVDLDQILAAHKTLGNLVEAAKH
jgi:hypothetical protein